MFKFIKEYAKTKLQELQKFETQEKTKFETPKSELETKRQTVYKIEDIKQIKTNIDNLRNKHTEISTLKSSTVELERKFTQESDKVFQAIAENAESQEKVKDDKTTALESLQTEIKQIVGDATIPATAAHAAIASSSPPQSDKTVISIQSQAASALSALEGYKNSIVSMYQFLKENNTDEFLNEKKTLQEFRDEAETKFKDANKIKGEIDAMVGKVNSKKEEIDEIIEKYKEIRDKIKTFNDSAQAQNTSSVSTQIQQIGITLNNNVDEAMDVSKNQSLEELATTCINIGTSIDTLIRKYNSDCQELISNL